MKTLLGFLIGAVLVAIIVILAIMIPNAREDQLLDADVRDDSARIIFSVTDDTAAINNVSEVEMSLSRVELHSETQGWIIASRNQESYDLLELKARGESRLYAVADVPADTYDRVRIAIDGVQVHTNMNGRVAAHLPQNTMEMSLAMNVENGEKYSVHMDVLADQSLYLTENGDYLFAPVIVLDARADANVSYDRSSESKDAVVIAGGQTRTNATYGMDLDGSAHIDFTLGTRAGAHIHDNGVLMIDLEADSTTSTSGSGISSTGMDIRNEIRSLFGGSRTTTGVSSSSSVSGSSQGKATSSPVNNKPGNNEPINSDDYQPIDIRL